jgi:Transport protein particle (TRAPP) component
MYVVCQVIALMVPGSWLAADMIIDNDPPLERHISVPRDMSQLSCSSFTAGIVEAVLDGLGFVRFPPRYCRKRLVNWRTDSLREWLRTTQRLPSIRREQRYW